LNIFQTAGTKYLEDNHPNRKKKTTVNGKTKTVTLKHLDGPKRNLFNNVAKALYYDYLSDVVDGTDKIDLNGILSYTDKDAAKLFFDDAYKKMQDQASNMVATNVAASNVVDFVSDDDDNEGAE
jgi:hypothetical protein